MADELENSGQEDGASTGAGASGGDPGDPTTTESEGFQKESFQEVLERVSTAKTDEAESDDETEDDEEVDDEAEEEKPEAEPEKGKKEEPAKEEEAEVDPDDLELLDDKSIDSKFPNSPKGLRSYAKAISKQFAPYVETVDQLGGIEAVKRLDALSAVALGAPSMEEGGNVDKFTDHITSLNPGFMEAFKYKTFYGAINDPKDAEALLNPYIQADPRYKDFTFSKLKELADFVIDGYIDLDDVKEKLEAENPKEAERRKAAEAKEQSDAAEKEDMKSRLAAVEQDKQREQVSKEIVRVKGKYDEAASPVLKKFGLGKGFIKDDDPEDIKSVKQAYLDDLENAVARRMYAHPLVKELAKLIGNANKGDGYEWLVERCAKAYKGIVREEGLKRSGLLSGFLKSYGSEAKKTRRPEPDKDAGKATHAKTKKVEEAEDQPDRSGGLAAVMKRIQAEQAA